MTLPQILMMNLTVIGVAVTILWIISILRRDVSIVDIFWGLGFVLVAWMSFCVAGSGTIRSVVLVSLVSVWGLRLSAHLAKRNHGKPEDYRYAEMRARHGRFFPLVSFFTVFALQGCIMWIVSLPIQVGVRGQSSAPFAMLIGIALWGIGFAFESVGDHQLARFKADPANRGQVMDRGLWRYTRHPNYFGDFMVWWGFYVLSIDSNSWWWTIFGPLLMSLLLIRVSGVRLLESSLSKRVSGYEAYVRNTSSFFPWMPRNSTSED